MFVRAKKNESAQDFSHLNLMSKEQTQLSTMNLLFVKTANTLTFYTPAHSPSLSLSPYGG